MSSASDIKSVSSFVWSNFTNNDCILRSVLPYIDGGDAEKYIACAKSCLDRMEEGASVLAFMGVNCAHMIFKKRLEEFNSAIKGAKK